jgi:hypothetical protein
MNEDLRLILQRIFFTTETRRTLEKHGGRGLRIEWLAKAQRNMGFGIGKWGKGVVVTQRSTEKYTEEHKGIEIWE